MLIHRTHGTFCTFRSPRTGDHAPGLRQRIDPAFGVALRAQRRSVIVIRAPIPLAVPGLVQRATQLLGMRTPRNRALCLVACFRDRREVLQDRIQEPAEPYAFALALDADAVHAIVPVAA